MIRKAFKYLLIGSCGFSTGMSLHGNDYDINSLGLVRFGRAAITVFNIGLIYKTKLYYKKWDTKTDEYKALKSEINKIGAEKLLQLILVNRGVYIKVGQHIGSLDYLLPAEYVDAMKILHYNAPQNSVEDLYKVIKKDLKQNPNDLFDTFDKEPLGTASLAQVHKATLKTGEVVAVKVQHPYVMGNSIVDMRTMELLAKIMAIVFPDFKVQWLVDETKKNLPVELNFLIEASNAEKIAEIFKNYKWLKVPKTYRNLSTSRVLIMEFIEGGHCTDINYIKENKIDPYEVSNKIAQLYSNMIFVSGFVHSDPHPGNILVRKNKKGALELILLDHGLYANLTDRFRYEYSKLWLSILKIDRNGMKLHAANLGIKDNLYGLFTCMLTGRSWESIMAGIDRTANSSAERDFVQGNTASAIPSISNVLQQVDRQMILILKTNDLIRGIDAKLQTGNRMTSFLVMSKCCVHSVFDQEKRITKHKLAQIKTTINEMWEIFKLNIYYFYLGIRNLNWYSN